MVITLAIVGFIVVLTTLWIMSLRVIVDTNSVHIVQRNNKTVSYGKDSGNGNVYYNFPEFIPLLGVTSVTLPLSVFDINLNSYEAYDKGRLPFNVDIKAFFRIVDSNTSASRVSSFNELRDQLEGIVQGSVRSIMANSELEAIMSERSIYGEKFTSEVSEQLKEWGVVPVKNIELMDIRDSSESEVIANIMAKKKSQIQMESRVTVAENNRKAMDAEIEANKEVKLKQEEARKEVGLREVEVGKEVNISSEKAAQTVKSEKKITTEKELEIVELDAIKRQEIERKSGVIKAEEEKEKQILDAEAKLEAKNKEAKGIAAEGKARADAEKDMQLARVTAEITLAKEVGENENYQEYLVRIEEVKAGKEVGIAKAEALTKADVKVIANGGDVDSGLSSVMDLFSSKGGTSVGGMLEGLGQTDLGQKLLGKFISGDDKKEDLIPDA